MKKNYPPSVEVFKQCGFMAQAKENPNSIELGPWLTVGDIISKTKDGLNTYLKLSEKRHHFDKQQTKDSFEIVRQGEPTSCNIISLSSDKCKDCPLYGKIKTPVEIALKDFIETEEDGFWNITKDYKKVANYNDLLQKFKAEKPFKTIADMRTVYVYNGTHYEEFTPIEIKSYAEQKFNPKPKERERSEFNNKVFANSVDRRSFFSCGTDGRINFKNGILDLESKQVLSHSPDYGFRGVLPYAFDPLARCETFDWWIKDVMMGDEELVAILQEYMGYVIRGGEYKYHKALWLSGTGRNGKSTFLSVLKALIGNGNYSTLSIKQIVTDKFVSADLDGKIANFSEETSPEELTDSGPFKNLTGDGELVAQKKYGDPYSFRNKAKLIMTYNEVPLLKDLSPGMLSRPIIIPWKKDLTDDGTQDKRLHKKLMAELPGIFNFALEGWDRLERNEAFTKSAKSTLEMNEIRQSSCSAAQWVAECLQFYPEKDWEFMPAMTPRKLYDDYKLMIGHYAFAEQKFYRRINALEQIAKRKKRLTNGVEYVGMRFNRGSPKF